LRSNLDKKRIRRNNGVDKVMSKGLNIKQLKFIDNLFVGMSQVKAYKEAGYKGEGHTAESCASTLMRNTEIQAEIKRRLADTTNRNRIRLGRISETALAKLLSIIQDEKAEDRVKLDAVKDALDRAGLKPVEKREYTGEIGFNLLNIDMSKYPKVKNEARVSTKDKRAKKGD